MAEIAYILLCHKDPVAIAKQARQLTASGDSVAIHFDRRASADTYEILRDSLADNESVVFTSKRMKCGWGEWSLVSATLSALQAAESAFPRATHFYMLSGDCMPVKTAEYMHAFLDADDADYIETHDFFESDWIKTGMKEERLIYRHYFNERKNKKLFYGALEAQRRLSVKRQPPADLQICIGSQWWCLRRTTVETLLAFIKERRDVTRFFATTWIPDETFFQTLVPHLVPASEIRNRTLTFLLFSDYGMPVSFHNDHYHMLMNQDALFARKISPEAHDLKRRLGLLYAAKGVTFEISDEGEKLFRFLTGRGRVGRRFAPRFWEAESTLGRERELMIIICKKWHVAKRLLERIRQKTNVPAVGYVFNEEEAGLPDLGGIENAMDKRTRHRRALMRMLFDYFESDRMIVCMDPTNFELLQDFVADRSTTRLLEIECTFSDDYLVGHAMRVGLAGERTPKETLQRLVPTIRNDIAFEADRIRDAQFANFNRLHETGPSEDNAKALSSFLSLPPEKVADLAEDRWLFAD
ncbi:MAG: DUF5928 domain-containing protein [Pseudomonadota bacterium]